MMQLVFALVPLLFTQDIPFEGFLHNLQSMSPGERAPRVVKFLAGRALPLVESDTVLTFLWYGAADSVFVNGALQDGWRRPARMEKLPCTADGAGPALFFRRYIVPRDARLEYQFIVNGVPALDPGNVRLTPNGDFSNSEAVMPGFVPTPWTASRTDVAHGTLDTMVFTPRDTTLKPRRVVVFVPDAITRHEGAKYIGSSTRGSTSRSASQADRGAHAARVPSIYIHDGETALRYMAVTTIVENMSAAHVIPPVVAVFVPFVEREAEYMGRKQTRYINALADELVPLIERRYPVARDAAQRGIMGISAGGHAALAAGIARPDVFGLCAGQSAPITPVLTAMLDLRRRAAPLPPSFKLYQQCGLFDIVSEQYQVLRLNREFSTLVAGLPIQHLYVETSDGHDWPSWRERVPAILGFFFTH